MASEKRVRLPDGRIIVIKPTSPLPPKLPDPNKVTEALMKEVPGDISKRLSKAVHKIKRRNPRGMVGSANPTRAAYQDVKSILFQQYFLPTPKKLLPHPPTTTKPTYDVDTFGHARASFKIER